MEYQDPDSSFMLIEVGSSSLTKMKKLFIHKMVTSVLLERPRTLVCNGSDPSTPRYNTIKFANESNSPASFRLININVPSGMLNISKLIMFQSKINAELLMEIKAE
jgi:hypothetical protein